MPTGKYYSTAACALGAAAIAASGKHKLTSDTLQSEWGKLLSQPSVCPACNRCATIAGTVIHLNDDHTWSREDIADWLDLVEGCAGDRQHRNRCARAEVCGLLPLGSPWTWSEWPRRIHYV